jgi:prepilin-type N-terminal cleavage/methylation domain-containing protein
VFAGFAKKKAILPHPLFSKKDTILQLRNDTGFTLIELVVVISLISIMLFFTIPRLQNAIPLGDDKKAARWIIGKVQALKESAVREQLDYVLNLNIDTNRLWVTNETMPRKSVKMRKKRVQIFQRE